MTLSRRTLLAGGLSISAASLLASCWGQPDAPTATPTGAPTAAPSPEPSPPPDAGDAPAYGPNGTHYPAETPPLGEAAATELEVDCSWEAIAAAVASLSADAVAAGAAIRVRPGTLVGYGSGSRRDPVLRGVGDANWSRNVLVCPRDGYGSVTVEHEGFRIDASHRLSFFGFSGPDVAFVLTNCSRFEVGWGRWSAVNLTQSGASIGLYELVAGFRRGTDDTVGIRPTDFNTMTDLARYGCVFGPTVKPDGDGAHCDTMQLERTGWGDFGPFLSVDCIDFGSSNAAIVAHGSLSVAEFRHCLILAERLPWQIFPLEAGDYPGEPNAFAGGAPDVRLFDSHVCGPLGRLGYTQVENTVVSYQPAASQYPASGGEWTVDPGMAAWTADDIIRLAGTDFSAAELERHWTW